MPILSTLHLLGWVSFLGPEGMRGTQPEGCHRSQPGGGFLAHGGPQMIDTLQSAASLLLATALTIAGCYSAVFLLFFAQPSSGWLLMAVGLPIAVGIVWLYSDLVGYN